MPNCRITTDLVFEIYDVNLSQWFPVYVRGAYQPQLIMGDEPDLTGEPLMLNKDNFTTVGGKNYRVGGGNFQLLNVDTARWHTIFIKDSNNPTISISQIGYK